MEYLVIFCIGAFVYLMIGYVWCCIVAYMAGTGKSELVGHMKRDQFEETLNIHTHIWPVSIILLIWTIVEKNCKKPFFLKHLSPMQFYEKGKLDNDLDYQAEKHLLGKKW